MIFDSQWLSTQASMQVLIQSASLYVLFNRLNRDNGALFLPKARRAFLIVATLQWFSLTSSTTVKNHTKAKM